MNNKEVAQTYLNAWASFYPIDDAVLEFNNAMDCLGQAHFQKNKIEINEDASARDGIRHVITHEYVHMLLEKNGYDETHKILFALLMNALFYHPEHKFKSFRFYDIKEDVDYCNEINVRLFMLASKRLVRFRKNPKLLLAKSWEYNLKIKEFTRNSRVQKRNSLIKIACKMTKENKSLRKIIYLQTAGLMILTTLLATIFLK